MRSLPSVDVRMDTVTEEELTNIKARCEAATPGPWEWEGDFPEGTVTNQYGPEGPRLISLTQVTPVVGAPDQTYPARVLDSFGYDEWGLSVNDKDGEFIAKARRDVPLLLAEIDRLRDECDRLSEQLRQTGAAP